MIHPEQFQDDPIYDDRDSVLYMILRRIINSEYADQPMDFNIEGLLAGEKILGRTFTESDVIADIGSSSGEMVAEAVVTTGILSKIVCIEPLKDAYDTHLYLPIELQERVSFVRAVGENIPLKDNTLTGATMHNVIFRAQDAKSMLKEAQRTVMPGGFIAISSNADGHAYYRHKFESNVAEKVMEIAGIEFSAPKPPAEGHYLEDLPNLISEVPGLEIENDLYVSQDTFAAISRGQRLEDYLDSIKYSAANTDLPNEHRETWRRVVDFWVKPFIEKEIAEAEEVKEQHALNITPCFADPIRRGMYILRNNK